MDYHVVKELETINKNLEALCRLIEKMQEPSNGNRKIFIDKSELEEALMKRHQRGIAEEEQ